MNERIKDLALDAIVENVASEAWVFTDSELEKFAKSIIQECIDVVDQNTYGPCGEYDYSYSNENDAADTRARTIRDDIVSRFGVE
jgi:capsid portal protein